MKYFSLILLSIPFALAGQSKTDSLQALTDERILNVYSITSNSASLWLLPLPGYGKVYGIGTYVSGGLKRPLEPGSFTALTAGAEGWKKQKRMGYLGSFNYEKRFDKDLKWTDEFNAYNGNPFLWADSSSGHWDRDHIDARLDVSARPFRGILFSGLHLNYHIGTGARTNDPKPFYRYRRISLQPGLVFRLSESSRAGISAGGTFVLENNELGFYNRGTNNVLLYRLRGYGTYSRVPFVSGERNRKGQVWSTGAHWEKKAAGFEMLLYGSTRIRNETVAEGIARPETIGKFKEVTREGSAVVSKGNVNRGRSFMLTVNAVDGKGRDEIFQAENVSYTQRTVKGSLQSWKYESKSRILVKGGILPVWAKYAQADKASGSRFAINTLEGRAEGLIRKYFPYKRQLEIIPELAYVHVLQNTYWVQNDNVILREIVKKDYAFMSAPHISARVKIQWNIFSERGGQSFFVDVNHRQSLTVKEEAHRTLCTMGYSFLF